MITRTENIPKELRNLNQWVCWKKEDKIPRNPHNGRNAKSNDSATWGSFQEAIDACKKYNFDGIGFEFANGYFGVDLDHCIDKTDFCDDFVDTLRSYAEISQSGNGLHIICKGKLPDGNRKKGGVEMYDKGRYFICTGNVYREEYREINDCTESIKFLHSKYLPASKPKSNQLREPVPIELSDQEIIDKARGCKTGYLFNALYSGNWQGQYRSQSEADLAFCNQLAFWTQRNEEQIDKIFRNSGLMRAKWDSKRGDSTYGEMTIKKACAGCTDVYEPNKYDDAEVAFSLFKGIIHVEKPKKQYDMTDTGNAHRLYDKFGDIIRYSYNRKKWYWWDGKVWRLDETGEIKKMADIICEDIKKEAYLEQDDDTQAQLLKWATKTASSRGKESMIKECQHLEDVPVSPDSFDGFGEYLNCQNGIVNLKNGELLPHSSNYMMSKICHSEYDDSGKKPEKWLKFLNEITNGDKEIQNYIQKSIGYSLTGSNREQCVYFLYGMGNNGKSTFLDTIADLFGGYAANVQPETIMTKRFGSDGANSDIARLKSVRFVTSEEPTEGVRLNEGLIKQLTGGSKITCRFLYADEFEYTPEFKIWVATNHKPVIRGTDLGIWRRIKLIPFEVNIPKNKVDKNLKYKLRDEFPQILAWVVQGCIKWQKEGIEEPDKVKIAVKEYQQEMDLIAGFMEQCLEIDYDCEEKLMASDLFMIYSKWAKQNNEWEMSSKRFNMEVSKKIPDKGRNSKGIYYLKVKLTEYGQTLLGRQYKIDDFTKAGVK